MTIVKLFFAQHHSKQTVSSMLMMSC